MPTPEPARQRSSFQRPSSAVDLLGIGALLVLVGLLSQYLPIPHFELRFVLSLVLSLALPVGVIVIVVALRRMALGLEAVYDRLEADHRG